MTATMNISMLMQMPAEAFPERTAVTCHNHHYSYADLFSAAKAAARTFQSANCRYVALLDTSSPAAPVALFGAAMAGLPYVPLNYRLTPPEIDALLERIEPAYLIADTARYQRDRSGSNTDEPERETPSLYSIGSKDFLHQMLSVGTTDTELEDHTEEVAVQLFTSGTTGVAKAALLRHENLMSYILNTVEFAAADEAEAALVSVPPYHIAGISALMSSFYACRRIVQLPDFAADDWFKLCATEGVTSAFVVPTMLTRIIDHIEEGQKNTVNLSSLRALAYGGGKMPLPVIKKAMAMMPEVDYTNAYGLTETSSTVALLGPDDHREALGSDDPKISKRLGSAGRPLPGVEVEIRDEQGRALAANQVGEILLRGDQISGEYVGLNARGSDGWFPTRDFGYLDEAGYLYLGGRTDDVIVRGGENISPGEIEDILLNHAAVKDVAVVGIPDAEWGESVAAAVVLNPQAKTSAGALQDLARSELRSSRVPSVVHFVDELPYNDMGKLLRREVRNALSAAMPSS